jgi:hypothetical protein
MFDSGWKLEARLSFCVCGRHFLAGCFTYDVGSAVRCKDLHHDNANITYCCSYCCLDVP